jgi:hypothetical protein
MTLHVALALSALAASAFLLASSPHRGLALVAVAAGALETAMALGTVRLALHGVPLGLVLGLALAVPGAASWFRASAKGAVSAAALVAFTGALQVAVYVGSRL